jgi:hypothetical protein
MPSEPKDLGYAPPSMATSVSPAAANVRAAAIMSNLSAYQLPNKPRAVVDQQNVPCCVSCALAAAMEVAHPTWPLLAPLFHYFVTRYDNLGADSNGFLTLESAVGTLTNQGICRYDIHPMPYTEDASKKKPAHTAYTDGLLHRIARRGYFFLYRRCTATSPVAWIRDQLRQNCPVVIGLNVPAEYPDKFPKEKKFEWQDPENPKPSPIGHCVVALGYDDFRQVLLIQDSKGSHKFNRGCWWMGYRVVDSQVVKDVYSFVP